MKLSPGLVLKVMASLAVVAFSSSSVLAADRAASVTALSGDVRYSRGGAAYVPLPVGTKLNEGDTIKTGASSRADVDLGGNVGKIRLAPNSTCVVRTIKATPTAADVVTETDLDLKAGEVYFKVNKLSKASRYEISTPKGIAGIRGTAGSMTGDGRLTLVEGMSGVAYPNNGGVDTYIVHDKETVAPEDKPPHAASEQALREIVDNLRDIGDIQLQTFVPSLEGFVSPNLPGEKD